MINEKWFLLLLSLVIIFSSGDCFCCTSLIASGKITADGRPLLLKQRDGANSNQQVFHYKGDKCGFVGLTIGNARSKSVLCGVNEADLSIINTAVFNLGDRQIKGVSPGEVMYKVLSSCENISEFEMHLSGIQALDSLVPAIFGVIDAYGGAAYYEVGYKSWVKYDVNDTTIAPNGYLVYTNFAFSGDMTNRRGWERYVTANNILQEMITLSEVSVQNVFNELCRSFRNDILGNDLVRRKGGEDALFYDQMYIANQYSVSATIFQGVNSSLVDRNTIMWTIIGYPPTGVVVPVMEKYAIPIYLQNDKERLHSILKCWSIDLKKKKVFNYCQDCSSKRISFHNLVADEGNGYMQRIMAIESKMYQTFYDLISSQETSNILNEQLEVFYADYLLQIKTIYD